MKQLHVDMEEIAMIMEDSYRDDEFFLDCEAGQLIVVAADLTDLESYDDDELEELVARLPEWERKLVPEVLEVCSSIGERYFAVPGIYSSEGYDDMVEFAEMVEHERLQDFCSWPSMAGVLLAVSSGFWRTIRKSRSGSGSTIAVLRLSTDRPLLSELSSGYPASMEVNESEMVRVHGGGGRRGDPADGGGPVAAESRGIRRG
ncbi:MAG: hypothetical protein R6U70_02235 [Bacillota bacterium]